MLSKILAKAALKAHKFHAEFQLQRLELLSSNPSSKISVVIKSGQQQIESLQRPKASFETELNETLTLVTSIFFEDFKAKYQDKIIQLEVNLHNGSQINCIGFGKIDLAQFALSARENPVENDIILVLEKSPEYQAKLHLRLLIRFAGDEENGSSLLKKLKNHSPLLPKPGLKDPKEPAKLIVAQPKHKRSLTPTPKSSNKSEVQKFPTPKNTVRESRAERSKSPITKLQQVANTVLLMKNATTTMVKRTASKSPQPKKEGFKAMVIPGPMFQNKYSNVFEEKSKLDSRIKQVRTEKEECQGKIENLGRELEEKEGECERIVEKIKDFEMKNAKLRKEIEKGKLELKKTGEQVVSVVNRKKDEEINHEEITQHSRNGENEGKQEKLNDTVVDLNRLSAEKKTLQDDFSALKQEISDLNQTVQELNKATEAKNTEIQELNKKQMDLKNEFLYLKNSKASNVNKNKINDLFSDGFRKQKELEIRAAEIEKLINEGKNEILARENLCLEQTTAIENFKTLLSEKSEEKKSLESSIKVLQEEIEALKSEIPKKEQKKMEIMEITMAHQNGYVRTKQDIADIFNLVFEKGGDDLMDELDSFLN